MVSRKNLKRVIEGLLETGAWKATVFESPNEIIRATKRSGTKNSRTVEIVLTIGKPNYSEREAIKRLKKAGEPFPVKKVQFKYKKAK